MEYSRIYRITNAMKDCGIPFTEDMASEFQRLYPLHQQKLRPSKLMSSLLDTCKESGISLGIITNGPEKHQLEKVKRMGLTRWFPSENILVSGGVGCAKPQTEIFLMQETHMNLNKTHTYMIGDSYANDITGAMNAGWHTIWINQHRASLPEGAQTPDYTAHTEEELCRIISSLIS